MTLEEAIEHAREVARTCNDHQCAVDHVQIAEWLSLLKVYTDTGMAKEVQRARHEMHGWQHEWKREMERREELEAENAKLRDKYDGYEQKMDAFVWTITGGLLSKSASTPNDVLCSTAEERLAKRLQSENAKLREQVTQLREERDLFRELFDLTTQPDRYVQVRTENTKLRELVRRYGEYTDQDRCEGCVVKSRCNEGDIEECWQLTEIRELEREL